MNDVEQIMKDLWERVTDLGFVRDGTSDEAKWKGHKINIGYGAGGIRVRATFNESGRDGRVVRQFYDITKPEHVKHAVAAIIAEITRAEQGEL